MFVEFKKKLLDVIVLDSYLLKLFFKKTDVTKYITKIFCNTRVPRLGSLYQINLRLETFKLLTMLFMFERSKQADASLHC